MSGNLEYGSAAVDDPRVFDQEDLGPSDDELDDFRLYAMAEAAPAICSDEEFEATRQLLLRTSPGIYGGNRAWAEFAEAR